MAYKNSHQFKLQNSNYIQLNELAYQKVNQNNRKRIVNKDIINVDYYPQQQQQTKQRSISLKHEEKIEQYQPFNNILIHQNNSFVPQPQQQFQYERNQRISSSNYLKKDYNNKQNNYDYINFENKQNEKRINDQIDIALNQKIQNSIYKPQKFNYDIQNKQQIDTNFNEFNLPVIHKQHYQIQQQHYQIQQNHQIQQYNHQIQQYNHQIQQQNSRPISTQKSTKDDSLNCTQMSFTKTQKSTCHQCKQDIPGKKINLVCWHHYHPECLSEIVNYQINSHNMYKLPKCLCGINIKKQTIQQLPNGQIFIEALIKKQLDLIYKKYHNKLQKCPTCQFRFILDQRLRKMCYCETCKSEFKIQ